MAMTPPPNIDLRSRVPAPEDFSGQPEAPVISGGGFYLQPEQLTQLRELRAEVQDLGTLLDSVRRGQVTLAEFAAYIQKTKDDISGLMGGLPANDAIRHLQNAWEQMRENPLLINPEADYEAQAQLHYLDLLAEQTRKIIFLVGLLTIPTRVNDWLEKARPGYYIPFHLVFEDELPDQQDRQRVLNYLAWSPEAIKSGLVDAANGLIYRYATEPRARWKSFWLVLLGFVIAAAIVVASCYLPAAGWPLTARELPALLVGWGAVLVGIITHIGVGNVKRTQAQGGLPPVLAVGDLLRLIDAHVGEILLKLLLALIGFFGLVFSTGVGNVSPLNTFLVGYTLDSFVELFSSSLDQKAAAQVSLLKQQIGTGGK